MCTYSHLCVFVFVCFGVFDNDVVKVMRTKLAPNLIDLCNLQHQSNLVMQPATYHSLDTDNNTCKHRHRHTHINTDTYLHTQTQPCIYRQTYV